MPEPTAPPMRESLSPEVARGELEAMRGHAGLYDATHPEHGTLTQRMSALSDRVRTGAEPPGAPADETLPRPKILTAVEPRTAAEALAIPPREFSEPARALGWTWDETLRAQGYAEAEREGLISEAGQFAP